MGESNPELKIALLEQALKHEAEMRDVIEKRNQLALDLKGKEYEQKLGNQKTEYQGLEKRVSIMERNVYLIIGGILLLEFLSRLVGH